MVKNFHLLEAFEKDLIRQEKVDFHKNLRITKELYKEAVKLGIFKRMNKNKKVILNDIKTKVKLAKVINSVKRTPPVIIL
ncbi:MAG: hypothetical protein V1872_04840 [bacterium]